MYDEVNGSQEDRENSNGTIPEPETAEAAGPGEPVLEAAESSGSQDSVSQDPVSGESDQEKEEMAQAPSFYHYSYGREQRQEENSGESQNAYEEQPEQNSKQQAFSGQEQRFESQGAGEAAGPGRKPLNLRQGIWPKLAVSAAVALVFGVVGGAAFQATNYVGSQMLPQQTEAKIESAGTVNSQAAEEKQNEAVPVSASGNTDISQVAENSMASIVAITTVSVQQVQSMFFGTTEQEEEGSGSGIIIDQNDSELLIATNNHVVEGAETLSVCFTVDVENKEDLIVEGQIKGTDPDNDLAVVAVKLKDIPESVKSQIKVIEMGDSDQLKVGQQVVAIGNALGYGQSLTVGYVSALDREVTVDNVTNNLIQTDAAINFGNSGGALLNTSGQLIGINSVKAAATGVEGMGYAIPVNAASPILSDLMNRTTRTKVDTDQKGYMGVTLADVSDEAKEIYNMPSGAFVYTVEEGSAAEKAGFKKGDIITKFDGLSISSRDEMLSKMDYYKAGETVDVVLSSANGGEYEERTVTITLEAKESTGTSQESEQSSQTQPEQDRGYQEPEQGQENGGDSSLTPFQDLFPDEYFGQ